MAGVMIDEEVRRLDAGLDALLSVSIVDLTGLEQLELAEAAQRLRSKADALCVQAAGAIDRSKAWAATNAKSATAWMSWNCGISRARASAHVCSARDLRVLPGAEAALLAGLITTDHVRLLAACQRIAPEAYERDEAMLVERLTQMTFVMAEKALAYWRNLNAADDQDDAAAGAHERREAHASTSFEGTVIVDAILDPIGGAIVQRELERLEGAMFEADWAEARERLGHEPTVADLRRTRKQRMADALVVMAERSAAKPESAAEARILLHVLIGHESVERLCELTNGRVITPGALVPYLDEADVERAIFDGPSKVIDIGVRQRLFRGATRWAVHLRDRGCVEPGCDVPIDGCQVDHVMPFTAGGLTVEVNGEDRCGFHNRRKGTSRPPPASV